MNINLCSLNYKKEILFEYVVNKDDNLDKRILDLKNSYVKGRVYINEYDEYIIECDFSGTMYINDSISLESIPYEFNIHIEENIDENKDNNSYFYKNNQNILDLKVILWQNIVLEVPISYTLIKDANMSGEGWKFINEDNE